MKVSLIVAMDTNRGIGKNNDLMWHLPADMKFFKETTTGHIVVMGRKNWDSIPERFRPLPARENVILTRNRDFQTEGATVFHSLESAIEHFKNDIRNFFVIGGGEIYRKSMDLKCVDEMYVTQVNAVYSADTYFPSFDESEWTITELFHHEKDSTHEASFTVKRYLRK